MKMRNNNLIFCVTFIMTIKVCLDIFFTLNSNCKSLNFNPLINHGYYKCRVLSNILSWQGMARPGKVTKHDRLAIFIKPKDKTNSRTYYVKQNSKKKSKSKSS